MRSEYAMPGCISINISRSIASVHIYMSVFLCILALAEIKYLKTQLSRIVSLHVRITPQSGLFVHFLQSLSMMIIKYSIQDLTVTFVNVA